MKKKKPRNTKYSDPFCADLYFSNPSAFAEIKSADGNTRLRGSFVGDIPKEKFDRLAQLVSKNGFFSMSDRYVEEGLMDAPPDLTKVIYAPNKRKEVSDNGGKGGEKLAEIKRAIYKAAEKTKWESGQK